MPLSDSAPRYRWPILVTLIALVLVGLYLLQAKDEHHTALLADFALIPKAWQEHWSEFCAKPSLLISSPAWFLREVMRPLCGASLLSAGPVHVGVAVAFLWIFGDNVEGRLGRLRFVVLWICGAAVAGATHAWLHPHGEMPVVGHTGAIAAILGTYALLFRKARVHVVRYLEVPCWTFIAAFFVLQIGPVQQAFGWVEVLDGLDARAHLASFVAGVALTPLLLVMNRCPELLGQKQGKKKGKKKRKQSK